MRTQRHDNALPAPRPDPGLLPGDLPGLYFQADDGAGGGGGEAASGGEGAGPPGLSEAERAQARAEAAEAEARAARQELLKMRIAHEVGVTRDALDLLTGGDEATLRAQAEKIVTLAGKGGQQAPPIQAGTRTQPAGQQQPTVDEQIAAAVRGGNDIAAIRLMRQKQGIGKAKGFLFLACTNHTFSRCVAKHADS
jgi:hypothetical protein